MLNTSLGKSIKKSNVLFIKEEHAMFSQVVYQPTSPYGFNFRFGYFCIGNFFIRGCSKLQNARFKKIVLVQLPIGFGIKILSRGFKKQAHQCDLMFYRLTSTYY
jgi:hypothetical protein